MKLITLNTHSIVEPDYEEKLYSFSRVVLEERPEILALQEVNQTVSAEPAPEIWQLLPSAAVLMMILFHLLWEPQDSCLE